MTSSIRDLAEAWLALREIVNADTASPEMKLKADEEMAFCADLFIAAWKAEAKRLDWAAESIEVPQPQVLPFPAPTVAPAFAALAQPAAVAAPAQPVSIGAALNGAPVAAPVAPDANLTVVSSADVTTCPACGSPGRAANRRDGTGVFFVCTVQSCGYNNPQGQFKNTMWDAASWADKKAKIAGAVAARTRR